MSRASASPARFASFVDHYQIGILIGIVMLAAVTRVPQLSSGTLYRDDAWMALTNRVSLSTALHMVTTTPGYTLFIREWTSLAPHATWFAELPNFVASLAAIVAIYAFLRWERFPAWIALSGAFLLAISRSATTFAAHVKPYSFSILTTILLLWLAERVRREASLQKLVVLALASVLVSALSFTSAVIVVAIFAILVIESLVNGSRQIQTIVTAAVVLVGLLIIYWLVHDQITPALRSSWSDHYLHLSSPGQAVTTTHRTVSRLLRGLGFYPQASWMSPIGYIAEIVVAALIAIGAVTSWRRQAIPLTVLVIAFILSATHRLPLGTDRTDTYLYPCLILIMASGLIWSSRSSRRLPHTIAVLGIALSLTLMGVLAIESIRETPSYTGGNLEPAAAAVRHELRQPGTVLLVQGTARWPWAYYEAPEVRLIFGPDFNTGFTPVSTQRNTLFSPHTADEPNFNPGAVVESLRLAERIVTVNYDDSTGLRDPLQEALGRHCWVLQRHQVIDRYIVNVFVRNPNPACSPK